MRPGPPPQPVELKILRGNPGRRPLPKNLAKPELGAPCPEWLSEGAKTHWKTIAPRLTHLRLLTELDQSALGCLCEALNDLRWANETIETEGRTQKGVGGTAIAHPAVLIARQAREHVRKFAAEFGLTPASRSRANLAESEDDADGDDRFLGPRPAPAPPPATKGHATRKRAS
jgi:P27 family predicted phage terminase small subunit